MSVRDTVGLNLASLSFLIPFCQFFSLLKLVNNLIELLSYRNDIRIDFNRFYNVNKVNKERK